MTEQYDRLDVLLQEMGDTAMEAAGRLDIEEVRQLASRQPQRRGSRSLLFVSAFAVAILVLFGVLLGTKLSSNQPETRPSGSTKTTLIPPVPLSQVGTNATPESFAFSDVLHGWAVGTRECLDKNLEPGACGSVIEATANGGSTWSRQYEGPGGLSFVVFVSPTAGWAWGQGCESVYDETPVNAKCHDTLVATTSGKTWHVVSSPTGANTFAFANSMRGWAATAPCVFVGGDQITPKTCRARIFSTDNGGRTWTTVFETTDAVVALAMDNGTPIAVERRSLPSQEGYTDLALLRPSHSGKSWDAMGSVSTGGMSNPFPSLQFGPDGVGWMQVSDLNACLAHSCSEALFRTNNGGVNWTSLGFPSPEQSGCGPDGVSVTMTPGGAVALAVTVNPGACHPPYSAVWVSHDAGRSWGTQRSIADYGDISFAFPDAEHGFLLLEGVSSNGSQTTGELLRTVDGGAQWEVASTKIPLG